MILSFAFGSLPAFEPRRGFRLPEGTSLAVAVSPRESCGRLRSRVHPLEGGVVLAAIVVAPVGVLAAAALRAAVLLLLAFSLVIQCLFLKVVTRKNADPRASGRRRIFNGGRF